MKETAIALIITATVAALSIMAITRGHQIATMEMEVERLEREVAVRQVMLADMHAILPIMERRIVEVQTEKTARELLLTLASTLEESENCTVEVH